MKSLGSAVVRLTLLFASVTCIRSEILICERFRPCRSPEENFPRISDEDLQTFSEKLLKHDVNNAGQRIRINYQERIRPGNFSYTAPKPLLRIDADVLKIPSVNKSMKMLDNYIIDSTEDESTYLLQEKITEESDLLQCIKDRPIFELTLHFLASNGLIKREIRSFHGLMIEAWFTNFPREEAFGSSAYEHIFVAEVKGQQIISTPNWIFFGSEESMGRAKYMGFIKKIDLGKKGAILKLHYKWLHLATVGCMFVGSSPELEMALYTTCFLARPDEPCHLSLGNHIITIQTDTFYYNDGIRPIKLIKRAVLDI